jgi:signal transduction histidine kinase
VAARIPAIPEGERPGRVELPPELRRGPVVRELRGRDGLVRLYAAVPVNAERTMYAVAGLPASTTTAAADRRLTAALLILLGCSVLLFSAALLGAEYQIRRPVTRLLDATTRFGSGEVDARAEDGRGAPELRELGRSFNRMADLLTAREAQMLQSQRLEAVGQLAGGVAHDFNNILTAIIGFGEELKDHVPGGPGKQYLDEVLSAADRAKALTHQLLAFSRRQVMQATTLQLNTVIAEFTALLQRVIGEDITLVTKLGSDLGPVRADRTQIEQVVMNLVVNARDAMPHGGLLTIETGNAALGPGDALPDAVGEAGRVPPGSYVQLLVTDTGSGIDPETQGRMFEPFFSTKGSKGTGLGLATVYGIVRQSGGYVNCQSRPGAGTTFRVLLPRTCAAVDVSRPASSTGIRARGSETVLVVEDEPSVRSLAATVLRHRGYSVVDVPSGAAAIEQLDRGLRPDLLLCDIVMPSMNGHQVAEAVRARHPDVRVVYMSGYDSHAAVAHAAAEAAFIQKPFTPGDLCRQVRAALDPAVI